MSAFTKKQIVEAVRAAYLWLAKCQHRAGGSQDGDVCMACANKAQNVLADALGRAGAWRDP